VINPRKLLASKTIIIFTGVIAVAFVAMAVVYALVGPAESMPSAERIGTPPAASGEVVPLDTIVAAFQRSRTMALKQYRTTPFMAHVNAVTRVGKSGWAAAVTLAGHATAYVSDQQWQSITPPLAVGQTRAFTCFDWQSGAAGAVTMYGCGVAEAH
jgi:hypothetical protein